MTASLDPPAEGWLTALGLGALCEGMARPRSGRAGPCMSSAAPAGRERMADDPHGSAGKQDPGDLSAPPSRGRVTRSLLEDLAAASRVLAEQGVFDATGHVSMRHPGAPDRFLMSRSLSPALVGADDIM